MTDRLPRVEAAAYEAPSRLRQIDEVSLDLLRSWRGLGEPDGRSNNAGDWLAWIRTNDLTGQPVDALGPWCASVQAAADAMAARELGLILPFKPSRSAKRYTAAVAGAGWWVARPRGPWGIFGPEHLDAPRPGDRVCWHRGDLGRRDTRRRGHVARVLRYDAGADALLVCEGNRNNRRDRDGLRYSVVGDRWVGDWRRRLYGVARLG